jgi:hypothetical protein
MKKGEHNKNELNKCGTKYPLEMFKRHIICKDRRKDNIKENRLNYLISKRK